LSVDVTALAIEVKSVGIKEASQSLGGLSTSATNAEKRIQSLVTATEKLQATSISSATAMNSYLAKLQQQAALMQSMSVSSAGASASTQALAAAMALLAASLSTLSQRTTQADTTQRRHNESMRDAHGLARGLAGSMGALWLTYSSFLGMAVGVTIGASLKAIVTMGIDVEHTLEGIRVRGQESVESINKLRDSLLDLGQGVYGPQQVAKAFETLILAGLNAQQAMSSITAALNLATVGGTSIEQAAKTLVSVGSSIGYVAEGYRRVGDVISKTAALSMSSVETLSEAFKSASSVAKLYGVSLEDIATSLGILSNLGIQGSAAGTALKNMYKELASEADKVQNTFKKMGLNSMSLKDSAGNFKPLLTVVEQLDGALSKLSPQEEKLAIARLSNERGMRLMVQALDVYRTKLGEGGNALQKFKDDVTDSYGFAAMGAVQMAQTAKSQIDSMMNTLKTVFVQTFKSVEPEVILFTQNMKSAFNSPEFKAGILGIANAAGSLALSIAENLPLLTQMTALFLGMKAIGFVSGMLTSIATGLMAIRTAMTAMAAGSLALTVAMPALAAVLAVATAAWIAYNLAKGEAIAEKSTAVAAAYSKSVIDGMIKEAEETKKATALIKEGKNAADAAKQVERNNMMEQMKMLDMKALANAREETERARKSNNNEEYAKGLKKITELEIRAANNAKLSAIAQKALSDAAKENAIAVEELSKKKGARPETTNTLGGDVKKAVANDMFGAEIQSYQNQINAARKQLEEAKRQTQSAYKQGLIGERGLIEENYTAETTAANSIIKLLQDKVNSAVGAENKRALAMKYTGEIQAQQAALEVAESKRISGNAEWQVANEVRIQKAVADKFISQGKYEAAYEAEFGARRATRIAGIKADLEWETNAERRASAEKVLAAYEEEDAAGRVAARNREVAESFNTAADQTRNMLKGVQTASESGGLAAMFEAAVSATEKYKASLPGLAEQLNLLTDPKDIAEANGRLIQNAENMRKMWVGVGESIGHSLKSAFGRGGQAAADLIKVAQVYNNTENKSGAARIKAYGDAAGAAKGFFKEGTTGYKLMEGAERAFRAIELAGMLQSLVTTGTVEAGKQALKVPTVLMEFMAQMGPWGMAAGAAAIAAIGVAAFGGSGGSVDVAKERQKTQGTGSVLGNNDAKSESIANSLTILEKNSGLGLVHSNTMIGHMKRVADGISGLAAALASAAGVGSGKIPGITESTPGFFKTLFGATKTTVKDQGITAGATSLGNAQMNGINASSFADVEKSSWWGLSKSNSTQLTSLGTDANNRIRLILDSMSTTITSAADSLGLGGDAFTDHLKTFVVDIGSISTKGMTGEEIEKAFSAVFSKIGDDMATFALSSVVVFQKVGEGLLETVSRVANDLIQVKDVFTVLNKSFTLTGTAAINVSESLIAAAGGLENLTGGTKFFVDNFLTEAEKMGPIVSSVAAYMDNLGYAGVNTIESFTKLVRSLDLTDPASQKLYGSLLEVAPAFLEAANYATKLADGTETLTKAQQKALDIATKYRELEIRLMEAQGNTLGATAARRKDELEALAKLSPSLANLQQQIYAAEDASKAATESAKALADAQAAATKAVADAQAAASKVTAEAKSTLEAAYQRESTALQGVIDKFKAFSDSLKAFKASLLMGDLSTLSPEQKYLQSKGKFESTSALAAGGDAAALAELQNVSQEFLDASRGYNASTEAYARDFNAVQNALTDGIKSADMQTSIAQSQLDVMKAQYEALVGIKVLLSFQDAATKYQSALYAPSPIGDLYKNVLGRAPDAAGMSYWEDVLAKGGTIDFIKSQFMKSQEYVDGSHAGGLNEVPFDNYRASLHKGERVQTKAAANASDENSAELVKLTKELLTRISRLEEHAGASNAQRGAVAEMSAEQMSELISKMDAVKRKLDVVGAK
jgi:TP901 family phage tail tape measure protein